MFYPIVIETGSEAEAFGVTVPDIKGCFSAGDTLEEALKNVKEAITSHLEILMEEGAEIPLASTVDNYSNDESFKGCIWMAVEIDISHYLDQFKN